MTTPLHHSNLLGSILSNFQPAKRMLKTALMFKYISKDVKKAVEDNGVGYIVMERFKINLHSERFQTELKKSNWIEVLKKYTQTPLTVVYLDYSFSMDKLASPTRVSHLSIANECLRDIFFENQRSLRKKIVVCLFASSIHQVNVSKQSELADLQKRIEETNIPIDRRKSEIGKFLKHLPSSDFYLDKNNSYLSTFDIRVISDFDIYKNAIINSLTNIDARFDNSVSHVSLRLIPTVHNKHYNKLWKNTTNWSKSKQKDNIKLIDAEEQSAKRVKLEVTDDLPPLPFDNILASPEFDP